MNTLALSFLGAFRVRLNDQPVPRFYSTKTQALLAYLAVESARPQLRTKLTGLFWPEFPQADANRSLRQALFQLNKTLDNQHNQILLVSGPRVQFNRESHYWLDVSAFAGWMEQGEFEEAAELYHGPFLDGFYVADSPAFEEWMQSTRERLHQQAINALARLTEQASKRGDPSTAQKYANRMLAHDPWREDAHRSLMLALAQQGQRTAALAQYACCQRILHEELGTTPEAETVQLYERIRNGRIRNGPLSQPDHPPSESPVSVVAHSSQPLSIPGPLPGPLPAVILTPLLGRQSQLTQILSRLTDPHCRLLTLVGLGGMGKTRLAVEAARELAENLVYGAAFPDGIWFVPLLEAKTPEGAIGVVARTLGITLYGDRTIQDQVVDYLRPKRLLLILDNFEHLLDGADRVAGLLAALPAVKVLVTSQEALNLWEEWFFPVNGLPLPLQNTTDLQALAHSPAIALFVLNARRRFPDFQLEADPESVARICRLVSGMPLAIELAASWLTRMSCHQIADQIEEDLDFLATAAASIPERHRSIRAVLNKTWELLSTEERDALRRLSIFGGGFHPLAAQAVAAASMPLLSRLVEKTLLQVTAADRYQMHELVRRYAERKLLQRPQDRHAVLTRHSDFYLDFFAQRREGLFGSVQKETLAEVEREFENLLSAWRWAASQRRFAQLDPVQESLFAFCLNRGRYGEGAACFALLVQAVEEASSGQERPAAVEDVMGRAVARQGFFAVSSGAMEQGMAMLRRALTIARRHHKPADTAFCLTFLGEFEGWRGNFDTARQLLDESITINQASGDLIGGGFALYRLGELTHTVGEYEEARTIFQKCVEMSRQTNNPDAIGYALDQLGYSLILLGDTAGADKIYQESLHLFTEVGNELGMALASTGMGVTAWAQGGSHLSVAVEWLQKSIAHSRRVGHPIHLAVCLSVLGLILNDLSDFVQAQSFLEEGLALARHVDFGRGIMTCLNGLAHIYWETGRLVEARALLEESLALASETELIPLKAEVLVYWAQLLLAESQALPTPLHLPSIDQAVEILTTVVQEMPIQYIFRQRAEGLLASLRSVRSVSVQSVVQSDDTTGWISNTPGRK